MSPAHATPRAEPKPKRGSVRPILSLAFAAIFPLTAHLVAPRVALGEAATNAVTFLGGALTALVPLSLASAARISIRVRVALGLASAMTLATIALRGAHGLTASLFVDLALVTLALAIGGGIGERVEHPGHLLPACVVAALADLVSLLHPSGPTHAIASSERALAVVAVSFPVPSTTAFAPVLGLGDLIFVALVLGVARAHGISLVRMALACALGVVAAGGFAAVLESAAPALIPIAFAVVAFVPEARRLRPKDQRTAQVAIVIAIAVAIGVLLRRGS